MAYNAKDIENWCEAEWDRWKADCSGFAKAVCAHAGARLQGQANHLLDFFEASSEWESMGSDPEAACAMASGGWLIIGGLKQRPNGHVVVVVKSPPLRHPVAYWGRLGAVGRKRSGVNWSWNHTDLALVKYYGYKL